MVRRWRGLRLVMGRQAGALWGLAFVGVYMPPGSLYIYRVHLDGHINTHIKLAHRGGLKCYTRSPISGLGGWCSGSQCRKVMLDGVNFGPSFRLAGCVVMGRQMPTLAYPPTRSE